MRRTFLAAILMLATAAAAQAAIPGRVGIHGIRLEPQNDIQEYTDPSWGLGLDADFPLEVLGKWTSIGVQFTVVNFDSETIVRMDPITLLRTEQNNTQDLIRFGTGLRFGPHGHGALQPFVGVHGHMAWHTISSTLVIPDDGATDDDDNTITQDLGSDSDLGVGWDVTAGLHINFYDKWGVYGGVSYFQTYGVDEPLGEDEVTIDPQFVEAYLGVSFSFGLFESQGDDDE